MAEFQHMNDTKVESPITAVVGNSLHLKVIPGSKEALPTISASPESIAKVSHVVELKKQDFTTFRLDAVASGKASLKATDSKKATVGGPIDIVIEDQVALPDAGVDTGLLVRLFLAEVPSPEEKGYKLEDAKTSMIWMRVVVENRLANPSFIWASQGAKSLTDVIRAKNQFKGFEKYPTIDHGVRKPIDEAVSIANNGDDSRRAEYKEFVDAALEVANQPTVQDPSPDGLFWWRTAGHGSPTSDAKFFMTKLGNTFFSRKPQ
jgi:hypothetical protein